MSLTRRVVSADPKPGHEMQFYLAAKHRVRSAELVNKYDRNLCGFLFGYYRARRLWSDAMRRYHLHGQDRIEVLGPNGWEKN